jgi:hypothetical protein|tara:strand:- start:86 stop:259 length:174 start_codon:yes stop_codon:yes gene_type:complete
MNKNKVYTVTFTTVIMSITAEEAAQEVVYGLNNNLYKNVELIVESENERPAFVEVDI